MPSNPDNRSGTQYRSASRDERHTIKDTGYHSQRAMYASRFAAPMDAHSDDGSRRAPRAGKPTSKHTNAQHIQTRPDGNIGFGVANLRSLCAASNAWSRSSPNLSRGMQPLMRYRGVFLSRKYRRPHLATAGTALHGCRLPRCLKMACPPWASQPELKTCPYM